MIDGGAKIWLVIALVGAANYLVRISFIALLANANVPPLARRALRFVAVAMIAALVVPMLIAPAAGGAPADARVAAAAIAGVVAWFTRSTGWTLAVGMLALWALQFTLPRIG
jgi:branched-subunit amino acid transport protein